MTAPGNTNEYVGAARPEIEALRAATKLRNLLRLNAEFSMVTGAVGLIAAGPVAGFLGVSHAWLVRLLGAGLVGFAIVVFTVSGTRSSGLGRWSLIISLNDLGWVAGTVAVIGSGWLSTGAAFVMGLIGVVVLEFGIAQIRASRRLASATAGPDADLNECPTQAGAPRASL